MKRINVKLNRRVVAAALLIVAVALVALVMTGRLTLQSADPRPALTPMREQTAVAASTRFAATAQATGVPLPADARPTTPAPMRTPAPLALQLPEVTPPPGGLVFRATPVAGAVGWVSNTDESGNHFDDFNVYAGTYGERVHMGAMQFDLKDILPGSPILYADLSLTGLVQEWRADTGDWMVELLAPWVDEKFADKSYAELSPPYASVMEVWKLPAAELARGRTNTLVFPEELLAQLQAKTSSGKLSLLIRGPASLADNLFSWDSGYGPDSLGNGPVLRVIAGAPPDVPPPPPTVQFVIITLPPPSPTPENVVTAAALMAQAAGGISGTATPLPPNWVTPVVIVPTPTPANSATAAWQAAVGTAAAAVYGTPTPLPPNVWTATPPPPAVVITLTPTPASVQQAIAQARAEATRRTREGTPTPFPPNVVTATPRVVVVASTPTPLNVQTVQAERAQVTISALLYGTATPTPPNWATPTPPPPLPLLVPLAAITPTPGLAPASAADPKAIPASLRGKILFVSDRFGTPAIFAMDPDGGNVTWVTRTYPYSLAREREALAPDGARRVERPDRPKRHSRSCSWSIPATTSRGPSRP